MAGEPKNGNESVQGGRKRFFGWREVSKEEGACVKRGKNVGEYFSWKNVTALTRRIKEDFYT